MGAAGPRNPPAANIRATMQKLSGQPHLAGTPASKQTAEWILAQPREYGLDAHIETFEALLPTPQNRILEMTAPTTTARNSKSRPVPVDPDSTNPDIVPPYNAYSGDGDVTAPLVYANYGLPADYDTLKDKGIDVKGKIVIVRYGAELSRRETARRVRARRHRLHHLFRSARRRLLPGRSLSPRAPTARPTACSAAACSIWRSYPGDPLSPGWASEPGSKRLTVAEATTIQKIPVLPISYGDAAPLLASARRPGGARGLARRAAVHLSSRARRGDRSSESRRWTTRRARSMT